MTETFAPPVVYSEQDLVAWALLGFAAGIVVATILVVAFFLAAAE